MNQLTGSDLELFCQGIQQFNQRQFFDCHETLEQLWLKQSGEEKELIQGLIQLAVAYHHLLAGNKRGALKLFKRGLLRLEVYEPAALGLELAKLCHLIRANIKQLEGTLNCAVESIAIAVLSSSCPESKMP